LPICTSFAVDAKRRGLVKQFLTALEPVTRHGALAQDVAVFRRDAKASKENAARVAG